MNWTNVVVDIFFQVGVLFAGGYVVWGGWISITAPEVDTHNSPGSGRPRGRAGDRRIVPSAAGHARGPHGKGSDDDKQLLAISNF